MTRLLHWTLLVAVTCGLGCKRSAESLAQDEIRAMDGVTVVLVDIKDDASAEAALSKLERATDRLKAALQAAKYTQNVRQGNQAEAERILKEVAPKLFEAAGRMAEASLKAQMAAPRYAGRIAEILKRADVEKQGR